MFPASWRFIPTTLRPSARCGSFTRPGSRSAISRSWAATFRRPTSRAGSSAAATMSRPGRRAGASFGGLFGLCVGAGFLILPGVGLVVVAGPIAAAVVAGIEGVVAGTAAGQPGGRTRRLGCSEGPGDQIREAGQGGQVSRHRPVHAGGRRPRPEPARRPGAGAYRGLRAAGVLEPKGQSDLPFQGNPPWSAAIPTRIMVSP